MEVAVIRLESFSRMVPPRRKWQLHMKHKAMMQEGMDAASKLQATVRAAMIMKLMKPKLREQLLAARRRIDANRNKPGFQTAHLKEVHEMQCVVVPYLGKNNKPKTRKAYKGLSS